jgi:hypothetical protein
MRIRFPDKPNRMYEKSFPLLEEQGDFIATQKVDGWRCLLIKDSTGKSIKGFADQTWARGKDKVLYFVSRRGIDSGGPTLLPVSDEIVQEAEELDLPDQSMIDAEWMKRRTTDDEIPECLFALGILWQDNKWLGSLKEEERMLWLDDVVTPPDLGFEFRPIAQPDRAEAGYEEFFNKQKEWAYTEGIVLRKKHSTMVGDRTECKKNKSWLKIKWRDGADGREYYV